ncbi:hypothetical protein EJ08DRAFT_181889 [Tothia fuscella]|uniref:Uncharacterized protein n=1 Tax=Tothia fuscella TaxID=1048955 RepID=A0A9P4NUV1_9PEZI|nr:hypothetical protein EJ08DRAFT_181889 [Tothia fuscella]
MNCFGGSKPACGNYMHPAWECSDCREDEPLKLDDNLIKIWACSDCRVPPYDSNHTNQWYDPRYWGEDDDDDDEEEEEDGEPDDDQGDENNEAEDEDGANAREDEDEPANQSSKSHASGTATELHNVPSDDSSSLSSHDDEFEETEQVPASEHEQGPSDTKLQANNPMPATGPATERKNTTQQPQPLGPGRCRWCEDGTLAAAADDVLFPCSRCKTPVHHNAPCAGKAFDVTPQEEAEFLCWNCRPKPGSRDAANGATRKLDEDEDDDDQSGGHKKRKTGARKKDGKNTSAKSTPAQSLKTASKKGSTPGRSKHTGAVNGIDEPHEYEAEPLGQGPISLVNGPATEGAEGSSLSGRSRVGDSDIEIGRAGGIVDLTPMEDAQSNPSDSDTHSVPSPAYSDLTGSDAEYTLSDNGSASDNDSIDLNFRHEDMVLDRIVDSKPGAKNLAKHLVKKTSSSITSQEVGSKASSNEQGDSSSHSSISSDMGTPSPLNCGLKRDQMKSASVEELSLMAYRGPVFDSPFTALSRKDSFVVV